ncbi:MAG: M48 family metalloprotease, partial [Aestuariivirgaceae bacterium]
MNVMRTGFLLAGLTGLFLAVGYLLGGNSGMLIALALSIATNLFAYWNGDKMVLSMHGAEPVTPQEAPEVYGLVEDLARHADLPTPKVYLISSPQPNAFATGRDPAHSAVAVTTGLLQNLSRDELAGVIAHELSHIKNRDTLIMTITATL